MNPTPTKVILSAEVSKSLSNNGYNILIFKHSEKEEGKYLLKLFQKQESIDRLLVKHKNERWYFQYNVIDWIESSIIKYYMDNFLVNYNYTVRIPDRFFLNETTLAKPAGVFLLHRHSGYPIRIVASCWIVDHSIQTPKTILLKRERKWI